MAWPVALITWVYLSVGRLGFYPTDEGLVQAYTYRILHGQVPHRDFISPRPLGSALLHIIDLVIPGPLFEVARVLALAEYTIYAVLLAWLIFDIAPWRWRLLPAAAAAASVLVNLNTFPLMSWYTVDGLMLVAAGYVCVREGARRASRRHIIAGFILLGLAALTKQSFVPAPAFGWMLLGPWLAAASWRQRLTRLVGTGLVGALPSLAFVAVISLWGGFQALRTQLLGGAVVYGGPLLAALTGPRAWFLWLSIVSFAGFFGVVQLGARRSDLPAAATWACRGAAAVLLVAVPLGSGLGGSGQEWSIWVVWMLITYLGMSWLVNRESDAVGFVILGTAWMSMLSWGYAWPSFVAGSIVLFLLHRLRPPQPAGRRATYLQVFGPGLVAVLLLVMVGGELLAQRATHVYLDRPARQLTATLGSVSSTLGGIRTNPQTAAYLGTMAECVRRYPARRVAVLPENAAMYPALSINNPFAIDWMWPDDIHGSRQRLLDEVTALNRDGDYAIFFQTIGQPELVNDTVVPPASIESPVHAYTDIPALVYSRLTGNRAVCGSLLVVSSRPLR